MAAPQQIIQAPRTARVPPNILANFSRQLATLLHNGIPLLKGVETLSFQPEYPHFGVVIEAVGQEISQGEKFSAALSHHPRTFSNVFVTMVQVGEETGNLDQCLDLISEWIDREDRVRRRLMAAFTYPLSVLLVATILSLLLFTLVLPTFSKIFREMNVSLPLLTQVVMGVTALLCNPYFWVVALFFTIFAYRTWVGIWQSPRQSRLFFLILLKLPGVGETLRHGALTRYCSASHALLKSGIDLIKTTRMAGQASASPVLDHDSKRLSKSIQAGQGLADSLGESADFYSSTLIQMVRAGEEASLLPEMYQRVSTFHELEMESSIEALSATLEPLLLIGVSALVGGIVLSIYLPMYSTLLNLAA
ncbi:type II secretion system F family protein [bacterium]|nr:type II secretion system F family protein [bacterium]